MSKVFFPATVAFYVLSWLSGPTTDGFMAPPTGWTRSLLATSTVFCLPCVVGVDAATLSISDGATITVDGDAGTVSVDAV